jgi:disulfide bond formation protein DsbB
MSIPWILIAVLALLITFIVIFFVRKDKRGKKLTPLAGISLIFVASAVIFGDNNRWVEYSLIGIGMVLVIISIFLQKGGKKKNEK